ncbi:MAG: malonate-semialdehyde dehydrogenase (acetylating) / methylmalonate-semialdehyde dehydrogenase, partial [Streptosporangiaceae bacterium]|nr:malonate-semialdehyde dehydrogenase (acetylating) / methylmalonate-semialdehyde dehydrogenase [Streptosporangiaceae bacterium]
MSAGKHVTHWINGKPHDGPAEQQGDIYDPSTGQIAGRVDFAAPAEVDAAVAAAKAAFPGWRDTSLSKRAGILFRFRELLNTHNGEIAKLISA